MRRIYGSIAIAILTLCTFIQGMPTMTSPDLFLMPYPADVQLESGAFRLSDDFRIAVEGTVTPRLERAIARAQGRLAGRTALFFTCHEIKKDGLGQGKGLVVRSERAGRLVVNEDESYRLTVTAEGIRLDSRTDIGGLYGLETLLQLLQADESGYFFPAVTIQDQPRFPWRGLLIDACRHWMPVDVILRNLDGMAAAKLNVLHWHLSEDQGFRVESKLFPKLHQLGSDGLYYTQEQIREIIAYAADRGIRVVPEFDMPGHTTSWFVGYPHLASAAGPFRIERRYGVMDPVMDPTKETTYEFLEAFWREMTALFPDEYVHIGGDENNGKMWNANAEIQAFKQANNLADNHALQAYFNNRLLKILTRYQKKLVGWDEILHPDMPNNIVIHSWRGTQALVEAAQKGYMGILSNGYYIDLCQSAAFHYLNDPIPAGSQMTQDERKRVLGGEATMWSEIATKETVDSRIWPRTLAIAERLWSPAERRDVDDMYRRMERISVQMEELGLLHIKNSAMMLRRLAAGQDPKAAQNLLEWLAPVQGYYRNAHTPYTSFSPFTRMVDIAPPESMPARRFGKLVDAYLEGRKPGDRDALLKVMDAWQSNHEALVGLIKKAPALREVEPNSAILQQLGRAGREAVLYYGKKQKATAAWSAKQKELIAAAQKPNAELLMPVAGAMEKLFNAVGQ